MTNFLLEKIYQMLNEWEQDIDQIQNETQKQYAKSNWAEWKIYFGYNGKDKPLFLEDFEAKQETDKLIEESIENV